MLPADPAEDYLVETLTVEYRLFTQNSGKAPRKLILNTQDAHRYGQRALDRFRAEVAPNIEIDKSPYVPQGTMYFMCAVEDLVFMTLPPRL